MAEEPPEIAITLFLASTCRSHRPRPIGFVSHVSLRVRTAPARQQPLPTCPDPPRFGFVSQNRLFVGWASSPDISRIGFLSHNRQRLERGYTKSGRLGSFRTNTSTRYEEPLLWIGFVSHNRPPGPLRPVPAIGFVSQNPPHLTLHTLPKGNPGIPIPFMGLVQSVVDDCLGQPPPPSEGCLSIIDAPRSLSVP
jgi:hypothetical protein